MTCHLIKNLLANRHLTSKMFGQHSYDTSFDQKTFGWWHWTNTMFSEHSYDLSFDPKTFWPIDIWPTQLWQVTWSKTFWPTDIWPAQCFVNRVIIVYHLIKNILNDRHLTDKMLGSYDKPFDQKTFWPTDIWPTKYFINTIMTHYLIKNLLVYDIWPTQCLVYTVLTSHLIKKPFGQQTFD